MVLLLVFSLLAHFSMKSAVEDVMQFVMFWSFFLLVLVFCLLWCLVGFVFVCCFRVFFLPGKEF